MRLETGCCPAMPPSSANNWRRRLKLGLGDTIEIPAPGGTWPLDVVGIYADYGNPKGQIAVNVAALIAPLSRRAADADRPARRPAADTRADLGAAATNSVSTTAICSIRPR